MCLLFGGLGEEWDEVNECENKREKKQKRIKQEHSG